MTTDHLTRRGLLGAGVGAAALIGLAACGSSTPSSSAPARTTRVLSTPKGRVTVPADPRRVVALAPQVRGTLYDLGVAPVGIYDEGNEYISPRYLPKVEKATTIGSGGGLDLEKIAAVAPDLIIGVDYSWNTDDYAKLTDIAPTVIAPSTSWEAISLATADAVDRMPELRTLEKRFAARAASIKEQYADVLGRYRWDILQGGFDQGKFWLYGPGSDTGKILSAAGVRFASASAGVPGNGDRSISYEDLDILQSADVIGFYANYDGTPNNDGPQLFAEEGFKTLPAVRAGRTVPIPDFLPGGYGDAIAVLNEAAAGLRKLSGEG